MSWVEISGKTLEEAKENAAAELGVSVDQIDIEVVDEGKGFLGLGHAKVTIKAALAGTEKPAEPVLSTADSIPEDVSPSARRGVTILSEILGAMDFDAVPALVSENEEEIQIDISGDSDDIGRLIGRHGQTLDALQYILAVAVNRGSIDKIRVLLDAEGYRERHRQMLEARALDYAAAVKDSGEEAVLEPQNARDRRIMHMALADNPDVYTYSEGEGEDRHVVISPKK